MTINEIKNLIKEMCDLTRKGKYVPILEADLSGFLFHLILSRHKAELRRVHLDTRVIGARNKNKRFDLVVGEVVERQGDRPAVSPEAIIEIKMFPEGFTDSQHRRHFVNILEKDLQKLRPIEMQTVVRVEFIFDEVNYLSGKYKGRIRKAVIVAERDEVARGITIILARKEAGKWNVTEE